MNLKQNSKKRLFHLVLFAILGSMMYAGKWALQAIPNVHPVGLFVMAFTVVYRAKALIPIYIFVLLCGLFENFGVLWFGYLYIWAILWGITMLFPQRLIVSKWGYVICPVVAGLFGLAFGTLYTPVWAIYANYTLEQAAATVATGFVFDIYHAIGNFCFAFAVPPLIKVMLKLEKSYNV